MEKHNNQDGVQEEQELYSRPKALPVSSEANLSAPRRQRRINTSSDSNTFPQWLLNVGFGTALILACACLTLSGWYLHQYLVTTSTAVEQLFSHATGKDAAVINDALHAHITLSRFTLLSCGIMVGLSFGFLGFGLFLLGVKGEIEAEGEYEKASFKFARMAPGVFVILCATVLVAICVTHPVSISENKSQAPISADMDPSDPISKPDPQP